MLLLLFINILIILSHIQRTENIVSVVTFQLQDIYIFRQKEATSIDDKNRFIFYSKTITIYEYVLLTYSYLHVVLELSAFSLRASH